MSAGNQVCLKEVTPYSLTAVLDNNVSVSISFNNGEIHLHFSSIKDGLEVREIPDTKLSNYITVQYKPVQE